MCYASLFEYVRNECPFEFLLVIGFRVDVLDLDMINLKLI